MAVIYKVPLTAIEPVLESELNTTRLKGLTANSESFNKAMTNRSDPITLDGDNARPLGKGLLKIIDGRHRIFVCRRLKNVTHIPAQILVSKKTLGLNLMVYAGQNCQKRFGPMGGTKQQWESYANTLIDGVHYTVTQFERGREGNKEYLNVSFDWSIGADARNDLSKLGKMFGVTFYGSLID